MKEIVNLGFLLLIIIGIVKLDLKTIVARTISLWDKLVKLLLVLALFWAGEKFITAVINYYN